MTASWHVVAKLLTVSRISKVVYRLSGLYQKHTVSSALRHLRNITTLINGSRVSVCLCFDSWRITSIPTVRSGITLSARWRVSGRRMAADVCTATTRTPPVPAHISPTSPCSWTTSSQPWVSNTHTHMWFNPSRVSVIHTLLFSRCQYPGGVQGLILFVITWVGMVISLVCLALCFSTFCCLRGLQSDRTTIHKNLCFTLFVSQLLFLIGMDKTHYTVSSWGPDHISANQTMSDCIRLYQCKPEHIRSNQTIPDCIRVNQTMANCIRGN